MTFPRIKSNNGTPVIVYTTEGKGDFPIHGAFWCGKWWQPHYWDATGFGFGPEGHPLDIGAYVVDGKVKVDVQDEKDGTC